MRTNMRTITGRITRVSISEKMYDGCDVHPAMRRESKIIIHDGWQWYLSRVQNEQHLKEMLEFLEIELTDIQHEVEHETTGKVIFYNVSKNINSPCDGGFWNLEQLKEMSKGQRLKKFKGLSNGSLVDCYIGIGEDIVDIYRPNPNAKEVYEPLKIEDSIEYRKNNWHL